MANSIGSAATSVIAVTVAIAFVLFLYGIGWFASVLLGFVVSLFGHAVKRHHYHTQAAEDFIIEEEDLGYHFSAPDIVDAVFTPVEVDEPADNFVDVVF